MKLDPLLKQKRDSRILAVIIIGVLFVSMLYNLPMKTSQDGFENMDAFSEGVVLSDLVYREHYSGAKLSSMWTTSGLDDAFAPLITEQYLTSQTPAQEDFDFYPSNIIIQRVLYRVIDLTVSDKAVALNLMHALNALMLAVLLGVLFMDLFEWTRSWLWLIGGAAAAAFFLPYFTMSATNLYWVPWTLFLPMVLTVHLVKRQVHTGLKHFYAASFWTAFVACFLKQCCYFEFTPTIMIALMLPFFYLAFSGDAPVKGRLKMLAFPVLGAVVSFAVAVAARITTLAVDMGSLQQGWELWLRRVSFRVVTGSEIYIPDSAVQLLYRALQWPVLSIRGVCSISGFSVFAIGFAAMGGLIVMALLTPKRRICGVDVPAECVVYLCSLLAAGCWFVLARPHATVHKYLCAVNLYLPAVFFMLFLTAHFLTGCWRLFAVIVIKSPQDDGSGTVPAKRMALNVLASLSAVPLLFLGVSWCISFAAIKGYTSGTVRIPGDRGGALYLDSDSYLLTYIGGSSADGQTVYLHLYGDTDDPLFTAQSNYSPEGYLNYSLSPQVLCSETLFSPCTARVYVPCFDYDMAEWGAFSREDGGKIEILPSESADFPSIPFAAATLTLSDVTDENWTNGVMNVDPRIVLLSAADSSLAVNQTYTSASGLNVRVMDVSRDDTWCHVTLDQPIPASDGCPNVLTRTQEH